MKKIHLLVVAVAMLLLPFKAFAGVEDAMNKDPIHKFGRGMVNVLTGWIEIPKQISVGAKEENIITGTAMGFAKGVSNTVLRLGVGLYEAVSFAVPYPRAYSSPYEGLQLPDYAWE